MAAWVRGWIAAVLAMLLSGCFPDEIAQDTAVETLEDAATAEPTAPATPQLRALSDRIARLGAQFPGDVAIAVQPIGGNRPAVAFNGERLMPQQSVSKLWVALTAFQQVADGSLDLRERVRIGPGDLTLFYQPIERIVGRDGAFDSTFGDLMMRALASSDNTANDRLLGRVGGPAAVRATLRAKGLTGIRFGPGERAMQSGIAGLTWDQSLSRGRAFYDVRERVPAETRRAALEAYLADPVDGASARAMVAALTALAQGHLLPGRETAAFLAILQTTKSGPNRLKGGLPPGWKIAHKTGTGQVHEATHTGYNDVGILTAPDGERYAVAVLIGRTAASVPDRMALMHEVVREVAQYDAAKGT